jgi:hypothetical protein
MPNDSLPYPVWNARLAQAGVQSPCGVLRDVYAGAIIFLPAKARLNSATLIRALAVRGGSSPGR